MESSGSLLGQLDKREATTEGVEDGERTLRQSRPLAWVTNAKVHPSPTRTAAAALQQAERRRSGRLARLLTEAPAGCRAP